jgi:glycosyltransferase involved in cell wall biosynthesis
MATYNRANFILESLLSIQNQTFQNWECLIIDDGGSDNTKSVIEKLLQSDNRFLYFKRNEDYRKGLPGCRNYGLDLAKGSYVIFFDDDDVVHPDNLKINLIELEDNTIDFCHYNKLAYYHSKPKIQKAIILRKQFLALDKIEDVITQKIGLASCTVLWKIKCFDVLRFNESLMYAEEWECYSRLILSGRKGIMIDAVLYYNRKHSNSNTGQFFQNNPMHLQSKSAAIVLIVKNLVDKNLLTYSLKKYFVILSYDYQKYKVFEQLLSLIKISKSERIKWFIFYFFLPLRIYLYQIKIKFLKAKINS